ncbi:hypothetical protein ACFQX6_56910 [Streptosporangium lutulentum]
MIATRLVGPAAGYAADVRDAIVEARPDLVVCSMFALGAMVTAETAAIPFHVLMPNVYLLPAEGMPPSGSACDRPAALSGGCATGPSAGSSGGPGTPGAWPVSTGCDPNTV